MNQFKIKKNHKFYIGNVVFFPIIEEISNKTPGIEIINKDIPYKNEKVRATLKLI